MWEFQVKFYWGWNEDYSLGDHISDSSEKLLQRSRGKVSIYVILVEEEYMQSSSLYFAGFCSLRGAAVTMKDFSVF